jgi:outer membrane protein TolC
VESAYMVMASQKFDWPGKRQLRGAIADSEANEAATQIETVQLQLAEMARLAFYDYYAAYQQHSLNENNLKETREFRETAEAKLRASLVTQQDVLQAEVELALLERRRNELDRQVKVAAARINTLLHQDAIHPLPPPPDTLEAEPSVPPVEELRILAIQRRPDLAARAAQIQADEATINLALKEFYPDVELYAKYDAFWQEHPLRTAVGVNVNVPLNKSQRSARVREAESKLRQHRAEYDRLVDEITNELHANFERLTESRRNSQLFSDRIIPAAKQNVESARAGYTAGKVDFLRLIEAQRQLIELREEQVEIIANYHRRLAELERAAAVPIERQLSFRN